MSHGGAHGDVPTASGQSHFCPTMSWGSRVFGPFTAKVPLDGEVRSPHLVKVYVGPCHLRPCPPRAPDHSPSIAIRSRRWFASLWTFRRLRLGPKPDSAGRTIPSRPSSAITLSNFFRSAAVVTCLPVGAKGMPDANRGRGEGLLQSRESQKFFRQGKAITPCERTIGRGDLLVNEQYQSNMRGIGRTINKGSCIFIYKRPRPYQFGPVRRYRPLASGLRVFQSPPLAPPQRLLPARRSITSLGNSHHLRGTVSPTQSFLHAPRF